MPISPICDKCHKELEEYGGILLSPPEEDGRVEKFHLCRNCYEKIKENLFEESSLSQL